MMAPALRTQRPAEVALHTVNLSTLQVRWAAIGAAVAVTLGAGGLGVVNAVQSSGERGVYTAIEPCRLVDTRPAHGIGGRTSPLGPTENYQLQATGNNGECTGIPTDAIALALNVTPVAPTQPTNLRFWPEGPVPNASSLNPAPGQPPTPNAVTVDLAGDGSFRVYNFQGNVHLVADVAGYYRDHNHDDRYYTKRAIDSALIGKADRDEVEAALAAKANNDNVYTKAKSDNRYARKAQTIIVPPASFQVEFDSGTSAISVSGPGAYIFGGTHNTMSAGLAVPVGARITSIRYHLYDSTAAGGIAANVVRMALDGSSKHFVDGSQAGTEVSFTSGYEIREVSVDHVVSGEHVLQVGAFTHGATWTSVASNLRMMGVEFDYVLP